MSSLSIYPPETHGGVVTSWIPIGSASPSSSGCESLYWSYVQSTLAAWDPGYGISVDSNARCVPPAVTTWWDQGRLGGNSLTVISLGPITCPSAYATVTTTIENQSSTFVACCPPNYTFVEIEGVGTTGECSSELPAGKEVSYAIRDQNNNWFITSTTYSTATPVWGIPINGYNIAQQITSPTSTIATSAGSGSPPATDTPKPSSGLSAGAKAGIGVGAAVGALILGALILWSFIIRRRRKPTTSDEHLQPVPILPSGDPKTSTAAAVELESWRGAQVYEVQSFAPVSRAHEVDGTGRNAPAELGPGV
ncbi:hypothetical protein AA313_de0202252 [Arthrobotrys entomopaga]|nr:hypothetical protein AA313_de0202252 [Arthrobotrys entomopaga]